MTSFCEYFYLYLSLSNPTTICILLIQVNLTSELFHSPFSYSISYTSNVASSNIFPNISLIAFFSELISSLPIAYTLLHSIGAWISLNILVKLRLGQPFFLLDLLSRLMESVEMTCFKHHK